MIDTLTDILVSFWATLAEMGPWLIFGFLFAGVLSVFFSATFIEKHLGRGKRGDRGGRFPGAGVLKAAVLGVPLPVCSCGVIPLGAGLFKHGASRGATSAFMLSTPQTGVDSIAATYALMGPVFAVVRPVVALVNGVLGGWLIDAADNSAPRGSAAWGGIEGDVEASSCCGGEKAVEPAGCCGTSTQSQSEQADFMEGGRSAGRRSERAEVRVESISGCARTAGGTPAPLPKPDALVQKTIPAESASCCGTVPGPTPAGETLVGKIRRALRYALVTLPADIAGALLVGVLVAALLTALVPGDALAPYLGGGLLAMLAAVVVGAPLYICATASIPVALGLMAAGASPGAVLAFLIAGPATNAATISVTWNLLGRRTGVLYLLSVVVTAVSAGLLLDGFFTMDQLMLPVGVLTPHEHGLGWFDHLAAVAMLTLLVPAVWTRLRRRLERSAVQPQCDDLPAEQENDRVIFRGVGAEPE